MSDSPDRLADLDDRRAAARLSLPGFEVHPLYGALPFAAQRAAIAQGAMRKVVLATSIAETSLTIQGVRVVVDSKALFSIIGSEMDWVEDKLSQRFVFRNPNISEFTPFLEV